MDTVTGSSFIQTVAVGFCFSSCLLPLSESMACRCTFFQTSSSQSIGSQVSNRQKTRGEMMARSNGGLEGWREQRRRERKLPPHDCNLAQRWAFTQIQQNAKRQKKVERRGGWDIRGLQARRGVVCVSSEQPLGLTVENRR